jgi:hypothetical protein
MTTTTSAGDASGSDLAAEVASAVGSADTTASQRIQNLGLVQQARLARLTRTAAAATKQYGVESAQAMAAQAAVTASKTIVARTAIVKQQATTPAPQVASAGWALHGRVYAAQLQPAQSYTVYLVDAQNAYQSQYGFSYTDASGYFSLQYAGSASEAQAPADATQSAPDDAPLFIAVVDAKARPVYRGATAFAPATGTATYQNIALAAGDKPLGDPPAAIRKSALPPSRSK